MPSTTLGWTRLEIVTSVLDTVGRSNDITLKAKLNDEINLWQLRYWKLFDWKFGHIDPQDAGAGIPILGGNVSLDTNLAGYSIRTTSIEKIILYDVTNTKSSLALEKITQADAVRRDPNQTYEGTPTAWYIIDKTHIGLYPLPNAETIADFRLMPYGVRMPTFMSADGHYPDIPIEFQETFMQYCVYRTLNRERDPRAKEELEIFKDMLQEDRNFDMMELENNYRVKFSDEELGDPYQANLDWRLWNG